MDEKNLYEKRKEEVLLFKKMLDCQRATYESVLLIFLKFPENRWSITDISNFLNVKYGYVRYSLKTLESKELICEMGTLDINEKIFHIPCYKYDEAKIEFFQSLMRKLFCKYKIKNNVFSEWVFYHNHIFEDFLKKDEISIQIKRESDTKKMIDESTPSMALINKNDVSLFMLKKLLLEVKNWSKEKKFLYEQKIKNL